ncbi:hypothetical protein FC62_GL001522 [Amylolactobacillus amylotrophicus DSM 20534]|uniref:Uncharacterized protein n=2 Tax=Amylolactobacillus TaxID=2767876 RepID=A0A0R1YNC6_9LACO|nr:MULTISPECIES: hypothetical protein [Amylolactobacillus]KRK37018.1 hypothetical protein FC62_GL001522 [Amylolactobacillus amylotrophicus DSM 20534]KRM41467.1 hypothetical protein FD40_GL001305 [Amylolactobacillus amylophilus DSM 20533 = JCM 1125]GED80659.1 hypothetical protein LAM01_11320 [Amylolactobacillus amylophilus]
MNNRSTILGLFTLAGLILGWFLHQIMVWTFVGMAMGYVVTYWIPYLVQRRRQNRK